MTVKFERVAYPLNETQANRLKIRAYAVLTEDSQIPIAWLVNRSERNYGHGWNCGWFLCLPNEVDGDALDGFSLAEAQESAIQKLME